MQSFALNSVQIPELNINLQAGNNAEFAITSLEENLDIRVNCPIVLLKKDQFDLRFTNKGFINKIGRKNELRPTKDEINKANANGFSPPKVKYQHHYIFHVSSSLEKNNLLSELKYSLSAVENYGKPEVHFYQQYRKLQKNDYDVIVNGWVYAARTAFGNLVNAIPRKNKLEFVLQAMDEFDTIDFRTVPLLDGLEHLYKYIETRFLSRGKLLVETNKMIHNKLNDLLPADEVGFIDPISEKANNLHTQASIFEELFKLENKINLKKILDDTIKQTPEIQKHFDKIFNKETWPIDLRQ